MDDVRARERRPWSALRDAAVVLAEHTAESIYASATRPGDAAAPPRVSCASGCPATTASQTRTGRPPGPSPSALHRKTCGRGWCRWATGAAAGTAICRGGKTPRGHTGHASSAWKLLSPAPSVAVGRQWSRCPAGRGRERSVRGRPGGPQRRTGSTAPSVKVLGTRRSTRGPGAALLPRGGGTSSS